MENFTKPIDINVMKPGTYYKVTGPKGDFLAKYKGKNRDNLSLHFMDTAINRVIIIERSKIEMVHEEGPAEEPVQEEVIATEEPVQEEVVATEETA